MELIPNFNLDYWTLLFVLLCLFAAIQLFYTFQFYARWAFYKKKQNANQPALPPVSVIIAARNESDNLYENLPHILCQDYPDFEVIVVNNQSIDDSNWILIAFARQFPRLKVVELSKSPHLRPGKKLPITLAIKAAKHEHFVLTDADCKPASSSWLKDMMSATAYHQELVIGYSPFSKEKGFLNRLVRYDNTWMSASSFAYALGNMAYKANGRNLAYSKQLFQKTNGFKNHYALIPGDDDLFLNDAIRYTKPALCTEPSAFVNAHAPKTWSAWLRQKSKHHATAARYSFIKRLLLGIYPSSVLLLWISFVALLFNKAFLPLNAGIFLGTLVIKWWLQGRGLNKLGERKLALFFPFWDLLHSILMPVIYYISERQKYYRW
jgi:cellulose synthase/poly-beta-1,6-N-acetylglucosamine synthase-like glycosyltransferase